MRPSSRLAWFAGVADPAPSERLLEVGCGHGVLISLLADRLTTGTVTAVDRSRTMVAAATRRNLTAVAAGRVRLQACSLVDADLDEAGFDLVLSFNVRAFWTPPAPDWDVVRRVLAPGGRVLVGCSVMGPDTEARVTDGVGRLAVPRGLVLTSVELGTTPPIDSLSLELRARRPDG